MLEAVFCINLDIMLVIIHDALFISHYAGFGTHSKLSNLWVASDSLWVEPLLRQSQVNVRDGSNFEHCQNEPSKIYKFLNYELCHIIGLGPLTSQKSFRTFIF